VYGWSEGLIGLSYLGCGVGFFTGLIVVGSTNDRLVERMTKRNNGIRKPEYRMSVMMFCAPLIAIGMFWYGWSAEAKAPWFAFPVAMSDWQDCSDSWNSTHRDWDDRILFAILHLRD
jgi:hypothetical protein